MVICIMFILEVVKVVNRFMTLSGYPLDIERYIIMATAPGLEVSFGSDLHHFALSLFMSVFYMW